MPIQTIDRGTPGDTGDKFKIGVALDTCQANDNYLDAKIDTLDADLVVDLSLKADLASPVFTGNPRVPTAAVSDNDTSAASTAFVQNEFSNRHIVIGPLTATADALALYSGTTGAIIKEGPLPTTTGTNLITVPNAGAVVFPRINADNTITLRSAANLKTDLTLDNVDNTNDADKPISSATQTALNLKAALASPVFTGNPTAPTPPGGDNNTSISTTAFVQTEIAKLTVATFADLGATAGAVDQIVDVRYHTSGAVGGGQFIGVAGSVANDGGTQIDSATAGIYWKRINYTYLSPEDFGAIGVTYSTTSVNCTVAFTNMFNWLNTGGAKKVIIPPSKYGIADELPQLIQSSIQIIGSGTLSSQDGGTTREHTLLEWTGGSFPAKRMVLIAPVSSAASARLDGIKFTGINIDCGNGNLGIGVSLQSCRQSDFDLYVKNAGAYGLITGVTAVLGESRDFRDNTIRYIARNTDGAGQNGIPLRLDGDVGANTCFNIFTQINVVSHNTVAIQEVNADNNLWLEVSAGSTGAGSATYGLECNGSNTGVLVRSEQFIKFSSNLPSVIRGTGLSSPAKNIKFYNLDKDNGCPDPTVEAGASAWWQNDNSPMYHSVWATFNPTPTASAGTFTSASVSGRYVRVVGGVHYSFAVTITTNGTAAGFIRVPLPIQAGPGCNAVFKGYESTAGAIAMRGVVTTNATNINLSLDAGGYPGADGRVLIFSGFYEVAA